VPTLDEFLAGAPDAATAMFDRFRELAVATGDDVHQANPPPLPDR
jgi:hypothetical protein